MRVFYSQKMELLIKKFDLTDWRKKVKENLSKQNQELSDNWLNCAIGERMRIEGRFLENVKDLTPEAIKLGYDFSIAVDERDNDEALQIIEKIEKLPTIWRDEI
jgi:hypothetical protein|tara:strand:- start:203 stop:514 length:312 start_codon:yes stop_codon:yes gene_type:complete